QDKLDTDANYKRMLQVALTAENLAAVHVGVASHNVFEVAYALVLANERGLTTGIQFEMLEGMANHQRRAICEFASNMLLYAPATRREEFISAVGYLVRRLDENTGPENFLRHAFKLEVDSPAWKKLEELFLDSHEKQETVASASRRTQDRNAAVDATRPVTLAEFDNDPHTDFSLEHNLAWAEKLVESWRGREGARAAEVPIVIGRREEFERAVVDSEDPSRPGIVVARYRLATLSDVMEAIRIAKDDPSAWRRRSEEERALVLARVAGELRRARADLLGVALAEGGKLLSESDPEVAEAIDFVEYYAASARDFRAFRTVEASPKGVVAVVSPWNFPIAIPCGGVAAALAAGNTVIVKPSPFTVLCAYELCQCFWRAGVPREALQFVPCTVEDGGQQLVASSDVDVVILTGGTATALAMLEAKPDMALLAETGGKNATIVTAMSDRDLAIKHVLHSAFGHSGQKCSATSLLVLEGEVYDDPAFRSTLLDAVRSLQVGSAWSFDTRLGPLIRPPQGHLLRGLKELDEGESWALLSENRDDNPCLHSPAVKWGVRPGSYSHLTEFFGPVLSVMRADDLDHAIAIVNQTGYGLTSGIESLDERELAHWRRHIRAGNLYVNRVTTGAIVLRQPFGGVGKSAFGPGIKAGGPNYVAQLLDFTDRPADAVAKAAVEPGAERAIVATGTMLAAGTFRCEELELLRRGLTERILRGGEPGLPADDCKRTLIAMESYASSHDGEFSVEHDHFKLVGQDNLRRYRPVGRLRIRVHPDDSPFEVLARIAAAYLVGAEVTVSQPPGAPHPTVAALAALTRTWKPPLVVVVESDVQLAEVIRVRGTDRVRFAAPERVPLVVHAAVGDSGIHLARARVLVEGRVELLWYVEEQSVSHDYHRYGNLGVRSDEARRPVP
ncbi:MAG: proline dehydrogenase family protein, partial [Deltaproteobacteria bacterium]|nr:proline dehydrogenase family protein [Deltaproteobacteria bacterium]